MANMMNQAEKKNILSQNRNTVVSLLEKMKPQMALALPKHLTPDRLARLALTEFSKVPKLSECDPYSFIACIMICGQMGLEPGPLAHCYLIPFQNNKTGKLECTFMLSYKGMIELARRSGQIISLSAHAVYEKDKFSYSFGLNETLEHVPAFGDRGKFIAVYACAKLQGGGVQFDVLSHHEIEQIRQSSKAKNSIPWLNHFDEMARKSAIRRLFKYLPVSIDIQKAVAFEDKADMGNTTALEIMQSDSDLDFASNFIGHNTGETVDTNTGEISQADQLAEQLKPSAPVEPTKPTASSANIDQLTAITDLMREQNINNNRRLELLKKFNVNDIVKLTEDQAEEFIVMLANKSY